MPVIYKRSVSEAFHHSRKASFSIERKLHNYFLEVKIGFPFGKSVESFKLQ